MFAMFSKKKVCCPHNADVGLLLIRLGLAAVFIVHGWMKLSNMDATVGFFATLGLSAAIAWIVTLFEFVGGVMMLLGTYVCVAGAMLALVMIGAIATVKGGMGFVGGYEFDAMLLLAAVGVALAGPGKYNACAMIAKGAGKGKEGGCCSGGACKM